MNRYKITEAQLAITKRFLSGKPTTNVPNFAKRFRDELSVKKGIVYYNNKRIVPIEQVDTYLRNALYTKGENVPLSRDGCFHAMKGRQIVGISRRHVMNFIKAQPAIEMGKAAIPKRKKAGKKLKNISIETDLIFIRKDDLVNINKKFQRSTIPRESYIVSTVEKLTGLTRIDYVKTKLPRDVGPIVKKHVLSICKQLGVDSKTVDLSHDGGGEFRPEYLKRFVKNHSVVKVCPSVEKKNQDVQRTFYQLFRTRRTDNIVDALQQTQDIVNNNINRIQKKTSNESAAVVRDDKKIDEVRSNYNQKRQRADPSDKRRINVGDTVRILIKTDKDAGIGFKSYKGQTYSTETYTVKKKTKTAKIPKYRLSNNKWYTANSILVSRPEDVISKALVEKRDTTSAKLVDLKERLHILKRKKALKNKDKQETRVIDDEKAPKRRPQRKAAKKQRLDHLRSLKEGRLVDKLLGV